MNAIFMNSESSKISDPNSLVLNIAGRIQSDEYLALSNCYTYRNIKTSKKAKNSKYQDQHGMKNLNFLMDHILFPIFKSILSTLLKNMKHSLIT